MCNKRQPASLAPTLFDDEIEDVSKVKIAETVIAPVSTRDVDEFAKVWHYTQHGGSSLWCWGLWIGNNLLGVVAYNLPRRSVCDSIFGPEHHEHVWHMGRLVMRDDAPRNSESRLIAGSLREIEKEHSNVWAILTYAAQDAGHVGTVYQATNAKYIGTGGDPVYYVDQSGNRRGTYGSRGRIHAAEARTRGWQVVKGLPKHRYIYILGSKTQRRQRAAMLRFKELPYPKSVAPQS